MPVNRIAQVPFSPVVLDQNWLAMLASGVHKPGMTNAVIDWRVDLLAVLTGKPAIDLFADTVFLRVVR